MRSSVHVHGASLRGLVPPQVAAAAAAIAFIEAATQANERYAVESAVAAAALAVSWRRRTTLRPIGIVALALALWAAVAAVHLVQGTGGDVDVRSVYPSEGDSLTHGVYPRSEYPPGAVLLFAFEAAVANPRIVNPFVMALCAAAIAAALCSLGTPSSRWLALGVVLWPVNAFYWEWKFDALPSALLAAGAAVAVRRRFGLGGVAFGVGAAVKWAPALAAVLLVAWLIARRDVASARKHLAGFALGFGVIVLPFLVWSPAAVWASVGRQAPRGVTGESIWYFPLRATGQARLDGPIYDPLTTGSWANTAAVAVQCVAVVSMVVLIVRRRPPLEDAVAIALCAPAVFLLLNKVFSAQYLLMIVTAAAVGAALRRRPLAVAGLLAIASCANLLVYPIGRSWSTSSAVLFAAALATVCVLVGAPRRSAIRSEPRDDECMN